MGNKRTGQWIGDNNLQTVLSHASGSVADIISLLPTNSIVEAAANVVFERCIIDFWTRRLLVTQPEALGFMVWDGDVLSGTTTPVEALDPLSGSTFSWAHKAIMQKGGLPVPPVFFNGVSNAVGGELLHSQVDINVKRKLSRRNQQINLVVRCDLSSVMRVFTTWRTYYTYA